MASLPSERILITGPAGSGKTHAVLREVLAAFTQFDPGGKSEGTLCILPTYGQVEHIKRRFLTFAETDALFDPPFLTFTGLYERLFPGRRIRHLASAMERRHLIEQAIRRANVPAFRRVQDTPGFRERALGVIKEIRENGLGADEIQDEMETEFPGDDPAARRIRGFLRIALFYQEAMQQTGVTDHEGALVEARDAIRGGDAPALELLAVEGFTNFTRLEFHILEALSDRARRVLVTLPRDRSRGIGLFRTSSATREAFIELGFRESELQGNRRTGQAALHHVSQELFSDEARTVPSDGKVRRIVGADRRSEVDCIAREIGRLQRGEVPSLPGDPPPLREIGIIVRRLDLYRDLIPALFDRHGIPVRLVQDPLPLRSEPIVRHALGYLSAIAGPFDGQETLRYLLSGHVGLGDASGGKRDGLQGEIHEGASQLEERARQFGMPKTLQSLLEGRPAGGDGWASFLLEWRERLAEPRGPEDMAALIEDALAGGIRPAFESRGGSADGDPVFWHDRFRRESAALASLRDAVRESGSPLLWGGTRASVSAADLLRTVAEAVLESKVPLRDRRLNCVNVIDAREARHWDSLRVVFVAGLLEKEFPIYPREDIFIRDSERRQLNENTKLSLRENLRQRDEERYLFYVAATRARDLLYLCNPAHDSSGNETRASLYVAEMSRLFPEGGIEIEEATLADPCPLPDRASLREDLEMGIARSIGSAPPPEVLALYETAPDRSIFSNGRAFVRARGASLEAEDLREAIHQAVRHVSASGINDFIRCPHLYFVTRVLRLGEPPAGIEERLDYRDIGSIAHRALHRYHEAGGKRPIHDVIQEALEEIVGQLDLGLRREVALDELRRSLGYTLEREAKDEGPFKPAALETKLESVVLPLPDGDIRLEGRLDRIDEAEIDGRRLRILVDYKRSKGFRKRTLEMLEEMTDVQLPFYLLASRIAGGAPVVGVELYPLRERTRGGIYLKDVEAQVGGRVESKRYSLFLSEDEFESWVDLCRDVVSKAIHRIRAGDLGREPVEPAACTPDGCSAYLICRPDRRRLYAANRGREGGPR